MTTTRRRRRRPAARRGPLLGANPLAVLALVTAAVLTGLGKVTPDAFLLLVTGLAIPAKDSGYQTVQPDTPEQL